MNCEGLEAQGYMLEVPLQARNAPLGPKPYCKARGLNRVMQTHD